MSKTTKTTKKPDFTLKSGKLFLAQQRGLKDIDACKVAGIAPKNIPNLEATKNYQRCVEAFKDKMLDIISMGELAEELKKNIVQDNDKGAKNNAIKMALDKIEPDNNLQQAQQINIVLEAPK